jgi:hypothetical protein
VCISCKSGTCSSMKDFFMLRKNKNNKWYYSAKKIISHMIWHSPQIFLGSLYQPTYPSTNHSNEKQKGNKHYLIWFRHDVLSSYCHLLLFVNWVISWLILIALIGLPDLGGCPPRMLMLQRVRMSRSQHQI